VTPTLTAYPPGRSPQATTPGDIVLTHRHRKIMPTAISFAQRLAFRGPERPYAHWSHAALIVSTTGTLVEALSGGVRQTNLTERYLEREFHVISTGASPQDRGQTVAYAISTLGQRYSWWADASLLLGLLTGLKIGLAVGGQQFCSGSVARAIDGRPRFIDPEPARCLPGHLAKHYAVLEAA